MLNAPGVCSARVYTDILIGQAVTWKYFSFTDDIKWIKSRSTILRFLLFKLFICICTRRSRLKNDTNNNNETDGSKWLIVVVFSLDAHCSIALSLFYYRMYAQSFNTITPTNKRLMWEKYGQGNKNRYYFIFVVIFLIYLYFQW
jgi:hypothetical protein